MTILVNTTRRDLPTRRPLDSYYTPRAVVERCLSVVEGRPCNFLDPAAGRGVWCDVAREKWPHCNLWGNDIDPHRPEGFYCGWENRDLRDLPHHLQGFRFDCIATNPPYSEGMAEATVRAMLPLLSFGGQLLLLLRLTFLEGIDRANGLFKKFPPEAVYVLGRVNFDGCGDASPYAQALFSWRSGHRGETALRWLPAERKKKPRLRSESRESGAEKVGICKVDR